MKIFTQTYDLAKASPHRFWVAPFSEFKIGIKILEKGEISAKDFTVKAGSTEFTPDPDKIDNFTLFTIKSNDSGFVEYTIEVEGVAEKLKLMQIVTDSTVFEIDAGGGGDVPADVATQTWVNSQISDFITEDALDGYATESYVDSATSSFVEEGELTAYATKAELTAYAETSDLTAYAEKTDLTAFYTKSETSSATEISTALAGKQPTGDYALTSQIPTVNDATVTLTQDGTTVGSFTLNLSNDISVDFAGGSGGGITPEDALYNNINIPDTVCLKTDGSISAYNIAEFSDLTSIIGTNNKQIVFGSLISALNGRLDNNASLETYVLPNTLKRINMDAFWGIQANWPLQRVCVPDSVLSCDLGMLRNSYLAILDFGNTRTTIPATPGSFGTLVISNTQIYVPDALYSTWITTGFWRTLSSHIHPHSELDASYLYSSKVTGGAETGTIGTPAAITAVKSVYETDWATLSASALSSVLYVVVPDPE